MALWWPRVALFVTGLRPRLDAAALPEFLAALTPPAGAPPLRPCLTPAEMGRVIYNVLRWNVGPFRNGCFSRSFARYHFFRAMGAPVVFHLGVESARGAGGSAAGADPAAGAAGSAGAAPTAPPPPGEAPESFAHLRGHAWLTLEGQPFLEWRPERFAAYHELYRYPPAGAAR